MKIAILIIAAGASRRLGKPKQLLPYKGTFLLNYVIQECEGSKVGDVFVVLGANNVLIESKLEQTISVIYNKNWEKGMGNSIAFGVQYIVEKGYDGVIILVGDQPFFNQKILQSIVRKQSDTKASILISKYKNGMGTPSFFSKSLFAELMMLNNDIGAKSIVRKYFNQVETIDFDLGYIDIDTIADLKYLTIGTN